jgi:FAD/FMN-containing dehydrogenase
MKPLIADVESFDLIDAQGQMRHCSRTQNSELFRLAVGGYGLFGVIYSVTLRLMRRQKLQRVVEITTTDELMSAFNQRIRDGFVYGDFQFMTDEKSKIFYVAAYSLAIDQSIPRHRYLKARKRFRSAPGTSLCI